MTTRGRFLAASLALGFAGLAHRSDALTAGELGGLLERREPVTVIDVRGPREFGESHIPGALNIPKELLPGKTLPALGRVVVCGDGVRTDDLREAVRVLNAKPGLRAEALDGGMPAWQTLGLADTRPGGVAAERLRYLTYQDLEASAGDPEMTLVDLRRAGAGPRTDLEARFPALARMRVEGGDPPDAKSLVAQGRAAKTLLVLIDDGDGRAEGLAQRLRASGVARFAILAGGERSLATRGVSGLTTRESSGSR